MRHENGSNEIESWYDGQIDSVKAEFEDTLRSLVETTTWEGDTPKYKDLTTSDGCGGLGEIRFQVDKEGQPGARYFRVLGKKEDAEKVFIVLTLGEKMNDREFYRRRNRRNFYHQNCPVAKQKLCRINNSELELVEYHDHEIT